jgi:hypothetical protein
MITDSFGYSDLQDNCHQQLLKFLYIGLQSFFHPLDPRSSRCAGMPPELKESGARNPTILLFCHGERTEVFHVLVDELDITVDWRLLFPRDDLRASE